MVPLAGYFGICQFTGSQVIYNCTSKALYNFPLGTKSLYLRPTIPHS